MTYPDQTTQAECTEWLEQSKVYVHEVGEDSFENILAIEGLEIHVSD